MKKKANKQMKELDEKIEEASRLSAKGMEGLRKYEPYAVVLLAFIIIFSGLSVSMLEKTSSPAGFVVIDTTVKAAFPDRHTGNLTCAEEWFCTEWTECSEHGITERECLDFNGCKTEYNKPVEVMECEPIFVKGMPQDEEDRIIDTPLTGFAASPGRGITTDLLLVLIYAIAVISMLIVLAYAYLAYMHRTALHHSLPAIAYWLAMAGLPLSIYFTVTRDQYIVPAYIAFGIVITAFVALMLLKPWVPKGLPELQHVDNLLEFVSEEAEDNFSRIKKGRRQRLKSFDEFREKVRKWNTQRELRMMGAEEVEIKGLDKEIARIVKKGPEIRMEVAEIEGAIREREHRFAQMNKQLAQWADEKRREKKLAEIRKKQEKAAEKAEIEKEKKMKRKGKEAARKAAKEEEIEEAEE